MHSGRREKATEKVSCFGDFLSPVAKTPLSMQGARVQSLVRELDATTVLSLLACCKDGRSHVEDLAQPNKTLKSLAERYILHSFPLLIFNLLTESVR